MLRCYNSAPRQDERGSPLRKDTKQPKSNKLRLGESLDRR